MKRTYALSGLALVAATAQAQSSVTLYGIVDTGVAFYNHAANGGSFVGVPALTGELPSRVGLRGTEDLGGGLKGVFNLESGFAPGTGQLAYGGRLWGRTANIGLSTPYGTVTLGRQFNMTYYSVAFADVIGPTLMSMPNFDPYLAVVRSDNSIAYSGKFGGLTAGATYSFGRDAAGPAGPSATNCGGQVPGNYLACKQFTGMLSYETGSYGVVGSYDQMRGGNGAAAPLTSSAYTDTRTVVAGYYAFSLGKLGLGWIHRNVDAAASLRTDIYFGGIEYFPVPQWEFDAQVSHYIQHGNSNATLTTTKINYLLSKSTFLYALAGYMINSKKSAVSVAAGGTAELGINQTGVMLGIQHRF